MKCLTTLNGERGGFEIVFTRFTDVADVEGQKRRGVKAWLFVPLPP